MMELTTYTELEIAHRLMTAYAQKCTGWHGHRYEVEITVTAQKFNEDGMIVDFKKLKEVVKTVLDDKWDHGACVRADDPLARPLMEDAHHERVHIINANPTLEWMVEHWALELQKALDNFCPGVAVSMLKASETARNTVTWRCNCLPWERSESVGDAKKPICADKETEKVKDAAAVAVDAFTPTDELEDSTPAGVEEEHYVPVEDTALYLVQFRTERMPYSTTVRTPLIGEELVEYCKREARAFASRILSRVPGKCAEDASIVLLDISRLPG